MNPHLELLLSRAYDGALAPEHRADLERSGLTDETIRAQFIRSVPPALLSCLLGFDPPIRSAMLLPFRSPAGGFMDHVRVRVFPPYKDGRGQTTKYLQPRGSRPRLYFTASTMRATCEGRGPLWTIEGEKKTLAVAQAGAAAVGISGVDGWHEAGTRALLPDFDHLDLADRCVKLWPDADWRTNPHVERAVRQFAHALLARGARVELVVPPALSV